MSDEKSVLSLAMEDAKQMLEKLETASAQFAKLQEVVAKLNAGDETAFAGIQVSISLPGATAPIGTFKADGSLMDDARKDPAWATAVKGFVTASLNEHGLAVMDCWAHLHAIATSAKAHCDAQRAAFDAAQPPS